MEQSVPRGSAAPIRRYLRCVARVLRTSLPDGAFHVFIRGVESIPPFPEPTDRTAALGLLFKSAGRFDLEIDAACVMTTHYHALVVGMQVQLSAAMQWLHSRYACAFNKRRGRYGHVFAERFQTRVAATETDILRIRTYVLENPVKAGLCERPEDWPWSYSRYGFDLV